MAVGNRLNLTEQQLEFVRAYVRIGKGSAAYRIAYDATNMTPKAVSVETARLMKHPRISLAIQEGRGEADKQLLVDVRRISAEMARVALVDSRDMLDEHGNLLPAEQWSED